MRNPRKTHDKRFAYAAKELTYKIRRDVNDAEITWECFMTETSEGGAGSCIVNAPGFKRKRYIVCANGRGHWYTL